jgi:hypothetical protein
VGECDSVAVHQHKCIAGEDTALPQPLQSCTTMHPQARAQTHAITESRGGGGGTPWAEKVYQPVMVGWVVLCQAARAHLFHN